MRPLCGREPATDAVLAAVDAAIAAGAELAEAVLMTESSALTRFAAGRIHQNVGEENAELRVRAAIGRRVAVASSNDLSAAHIRALATRSVAMARLSPNDPHFAGLPGPHASDTARPHKPDQPARPVTFYESSAASTEEGRAAAVGSVLSRLGSARADGFGALTAGVTELAVANSLGVTEYEASTDAWMSVIAERSGATGYASSADRDYDRLDIARVADAALAKTEPLPEMIPAPGEYTVVLEEEAVAELLLFLSLYALNGLAYVEGRSLFSDRLGEHRYPDHITLLDDPANPRGPAVPFDFEGTPKVPLALIREGTIRAVALDHQTAARMDTGSTGHALPAPNTFGPVPTNLFLKPSPTRSTTHSSPAPRGGAVPDLVQDVERGLLVTRFHYVNAVDPHETLLTGMTRDGTFVVEDGAVVARAPNLRWVDSIDRILRNTRGIGSTSRLVSEGPGYGMRFMSGALTPPLLVDGFVVTGHS